MSGSQPPLGLILRQPSASLIAPGAASFSAAIRAAIRVKVTVPRVCYDVAGRSDGRTVRAKVEGRVTEQPCPQSVHC